MLSKIGYDAFKISTNSNQIKTHLRIKAVLESDNVGMGILNELPHDLKLSIFEAFVLKDLFDGNDFARFHDCCLEDNSK